MENRAEYSALTAAIEGNPEPLAEFVRSVGDLRTEEARTWVAARVKGEKHKRGLKRLPAQVQREAIVVGRVLHIMRTEQVTLHRAVEICCDRNPEMNPETVGTYLRRAGVSAQEARKRVEEPLPQLVPVKILYEGEVISGMMVGEDIEDF